MPMKIMQQENGYAAVSTVARKNVTANRERIYFAIVYFVYEAHMPWASVPVAAQKSRTGTPAHDMNKYMESLRDGKGMYPSLLLCAEKKTNNEE